jgi:hypothetical protein
MGYDKIIAELGWVSGDVIVACFDVLYRNYAEQFG